MQNKTNRWLEVQIVIGTLALTFSLALWNLLAGGNRPATASAAASAQAQAIQASPAQSQSMQVSVPQASGPIFFGGAAPGSEPAFRAPAPVAVTRSSRP